MKIDKITQSPVDFSSKRKNAQHASHNITFVGKKPQGLPEKITESLHGKKVLRFMQEKLAWMKGEIGGVAMTAAGTGLVAPWPIAFNPMVKAKEGATEEEKEDVKNTKYYTAWRQPISAVLAAIFQIGALTPIDKFLDYLYNNPTLAKTFDVDTNQSVLNNDGFVKRLVQKEMKKEGLTKASMGKEKFAEELKKRSNEFKNKQIEDLASKIQATNQIQVGKEFIDNHKVATIVNEQIDSYIKDAKNLKVDEHGLEFYNKRSKVLIENEEYLKQIFKDLPEDKAKLTEKLKELASKEKNADVKVLLEEILDREPEIQKSRIKRTFSRIERIKKLCGGTYSPEKYQQELLNRNAELDNIIKHFEEIKIKDVKAATPEKIGKAVEGAAECCLFDRKNHLRVSLLHDTATFGTDKEKITKKIYKDITKGYKKFVQRSYKSHNQLWKIAIGVCITLPITCNVLNWVYPRFMDWAFPKLAGSKAKSKQAEKEKEVK